MSESKKPFAVTANNGRREWVEFGQHRYAVVLADLTAGHVARELNEAVEAREREVRAEMAGPFRIWFDMFLEAGGVVTPAQHELLRACGLPVPDEADRALAMELLASHVSNKELRAECKRRGIHLVESPPVDQITSGIEGGATIASYLMNAAGDIRQGMALMVDSLTGAVMPANGVSSVVGFALEDSQPAVDEAGAPLRGADGRHLHRVLMTVGGAAAIPVSSGRPRPFFTYR